MKQLIVEGTEDVQTDKFYISEIGKYGTNSDLPFLYQRVATSNLCEHATSKRRLAVLRPVRDLGVSEWETNFVAQTIRELEAYPEANLPE